MLNAPISKVLRSISSNETFGTKKLGTKGAAARMMRAVAEPMARGTSGLTGVAIPSDRRVRAGNDRTQGRISDAKSGHVRKKVLGCTVGIEWKPEVEQDSLRPRLELDAGATNSCVPRWTRPRNEPVASVIRGWL